MASLPPASSIMGLSDIVSLFHSLSFQAQDQAKAAYENDYPFSDNGVDWILLIGPYWLHKKFGSFSEAESTVRALETSDSEDFEESLKLLRLMRSPAPILNELYLLGTEESFNRLERVIASTDEFPQPVIQAMSADFA